MESDIKKDPEEWYTETMIKVKHERLLAFHIAFQFLFYFHAR